MRQFIIDELNKVKDNAHNFNLQDQEIDGTPEPCIRFIDAYNVALKVAFNVRDNQANPVENLVSQAVPQAMPSETIPCEQKCDVCNGWKKINDIYGECNTLRTSPYDYVIGEYEVENSEYETNQILTHKDFCCRLFANKR